MTSIQLALPPRGTLTPNNSHDPLPYYYHPWVGWLYRHRLQMGLDLLPAQARSVLEIGVGSGVLVPTLTRAFAEYVGTDLVLAPGLESLVAPGCHASFRSADLLRDKDLPENAFDAIVCFSVLEHIRDSHEAAASLTRALAPGGTLVAGYPMVNLAMSQAFRAIGYNQIEEDHVSSPSRIHAALSAHLAPVDRSAFPPHAPVPLALYQCTSWTKR